MRRKDGKRATVFLPMAIRLFAAPGKYTARHRREQLYRKILASYLPDLRIGKTRADAQSYLDSKSVVYFPAFYGSNRAWSLESKISEDPAGSLSGNRGSVYVTFDFNASSADGPALIPAPSDTLKQI
jgi:hypothetical protein